MCTVIGGPLHKWFTHYSLVCLDDGILYERMAHPLYFLLVLHYARLSVLLSHLLTKVIPCFLGHYVVSGGRRGAEVLENNY